MKSIMLAISLAASLAAAGIQTSGDFIKVRDGLYQQEFIVTADLIGSRLDSIAAKTPIEQDNIFWDSEQYHITPKSPDWEAWEYDESYQLIVGPRSHNEPVEFDLYFFNPNGLSFDVCGWYRGELVVEALCVRNGDCWNLAEVPEPATVLIMCLGTLVLLRGKR